MKVVDNLKKCATQCANLYGVHSRVSKFTFVELHGSSILGSVHGNTIVGEHLDISLLPGYRRHGRRCVRYQQLNIDAVFEKASLIKKVYSTEYLTT